VAEADLESAGGQCERHAAAADRLATENASLQRQHGELTAEAATQRALRAQQLQSQLAAGDELRHEQQELVGQLRSDVATATTEMQAAVDDATFEASNATPQNTNASSRRGSWRSKLIGSACGTCRRSSPTRRLSLASSTTSTPRARRGRPSSRCSSRPRTPRWSTPRPRQRASVPRPRPQRTKRAQPSPLPTRTAHAPASSCTPPCRRSSRRSRLSAADAAAAEERIRDLRLRADTLEPERVDRDHHAHAQLLDARTKRARTLRASPSSSARISNGPLHARQCEAQADQLREQLRATAAEVHELAAFVAVVRDAVPPSAPSAAPFSPPAAAYLAALARDVAAVLRRHDALTTLERPASAGGVVSPRPAAAGTPAAARPAHAAHPRSGGGVSPRPSSAPAPVPLQAVAGRGGAIVDENRLLGMLRDELERHSAQCADVASRVHRAHMVLGKVLAGLQRRRPTAEDGPSASQQFKLRRSVIANVEQQNVAVDSCVRSGQAFNAAMQGQLESLVQQLRHLQAGDAGAGSGDFNAHRAAFATRLNRFAAAVKGHADLLAALTAATCSGSTR